MIQFANHWRATLAPVPVSRSATTRWAAIFIVPWDGSQVLTETIWLIDEAGFGLDANGALAWDLDALDTAPASFLARDGSFFLLNRRLDPQELSLDERRLATDEAVPLRDGARLLAGRGAWLLRIG